MPRSAKDIRLAPIEARAARSFIRRYHYSGKVANNSTIHLGAFLDDLLVGVGSFGPPMDKAKVLGLVEGTDWFGMLELNRLAFIEDTPRNTESRYLAVAMRLIRREYPQVGWILTFADATRCGDGTIYRAAGFLLTAIKANRNLRRDPATGEVVQSLAAYTRRIESTWRTWPVVPGHQLRYIYFLNPALRERLTVPVLPYSAIADAGATMYRGERAGSIGSDASVVQTEEGGANPTSALHNPEAPRGS